MAKKAKKRSAGAPAAPKAPKAPKAPSHALSVSVSANANANANANAKCAACGQRRALFWHGRRTICEPCIDTTAHAAERGPVAIGSVVRGAVALARDVGARVAVIVVAFALPSILFTPYLDHDEAMVWSIAFSGFRVIGFGAAMDLGIRALDRELPSVARSLLTGLKKTPALLLALAIEEIIVIVHALFFLVPGFVKACSYAILVPLIVSDEAGPIQALSESTHRMRGHRMTLFPLLLPTWVPGLAIGLFDYGYGANDTAIFPGHPDADALLRMAIGFAYPLLELPWLFVVLSIHAKLRRDLRVPVSG